MEWIPQQVTHMSSEMSWSQSIDLKTDLVVNQIVSSKDQNTNLSTSRDCRKSHRGGLKFRTRRAHAELTQVSRRAHTSPRFCSRHGLILVVYRVPSAAGAKPRVPATAVDKKKSKRVQEGKARGARAWYLAPRRILGMQSILLVVRAGGNGPGHVQDGLPSYARTKV